MRGQIEAGPKRYSKSRDCSLKRAAGSKWVILPTKILEKRVSKWGGGHQAETSSDQETWLQEVGRGDCWCAIQPAPLPETKHPSRPQAKAIITALFPALQTDKDRHYQRLPSQLYANDS